MTEQITQQLAEQIARIVREVGKREDKVDEVANAVDFGELASKLIEEDGPVREAAVKAVAAYLEGFEIEADSEEGGKIVEAIDFAVLAKKALEDPKTQKGLMTAIKNLVQSLSDDDEFTDKIREALHLNDAEKILEQLSPEDKATLKETLTASILNYLKEAAVENDDDLANNVIEAAYTTERIGECLETHRPEIDQIVWGKIEGLFGDEHPEEVDERLQEAVFESAAFKSAVENATDRLVRGGKVDELVEEAAKAMLAGNDSVLRRNLQEAISNKLVSRIADSVVDRMFPSTANCGCGHTGR